MALKKDIKLENDIVVSYHRIANIDNLINKNTTITVYSYVNQFQRDREKDGVDYLPNEKGIYKITSTYTLDFDDTLTTFKAYSFLKTLDMFKGAEDVYEEED